MKTLFTAALLAGAVAAQSGPPASSHASSAATVSRMSFDDLKAIYEAAGVAYEVKAFDNGLPYLAAAPEGFLMFSMLTDCPDPAKAVNCAAVSLESGSWSRRVTAADLNYFNNTYIAGKAFLTSGGEPALIYSFRLEPGVSGNYVRASLKGFIGVMKFFGSWDWLPTGDGGPPPPASGAFAPGPEADTGLGLDNADRPRGDSVPTAR